MGERHPQDCWEIVGIDRAFGVCYNTLDNQIPVPWQAKRMALFAEQDNRVRIPNGTAAVSVKHVRWVKTGHWKQFREGCADVGKGCNPFA